MNAEPAPVTFTRYDELIAVLRDRRIELGLSQLAVDEIAGLPSGYVGKLEASLTNPSAKNARGIGRESLPLMLGALGLEMAAVPLRLSPAKRAHFVRDNKTLQPPRIKTLSERGLRGAQIRLARMNEKQRAAHIKKMNRARAAKRAAKRTKQAKEKAT